MLQGRDVHNYRINCVVMAFAFSTIKTGDSNVRRTKTDD